jgi:hypothetical protein
MEEKKEERKEYKIYKIICNETGEIYIGSTSRTLEERLHEHEKSYNKCSSKQIIERDNYYIEKIDLTFDKEESLKLERYYIETFKSVNIVVPGRTSEERYIDDKEEIRKKQKDYYEENKYEILERLKKTYTCECGLILTKNSKSDHERSETHMYFINNGKKKEIKGEQYTCECGKTLTKNKKSRHERSQKHQNFINSK